IIENTLHGSRDGLFEFEIGDPEEPSGSDVCAVEEVWYQLGDEGVGPGLEEQLELASSSPSQAILTLVIIDNVRARTSDQNAKLTFSDPGNVHNTFVIVRNSLLASAISRSTVSLERFFTYSIDLIRFLIFSSWIESENKW
ncbi:hypothetical protein Dimus_037530, partial [Dionaea muscipula]